jgi:hypothetical protein
VTRIYLNPDVAGAAKDKPDPGYIDLPEVAPSYNILKTDPAKFGPAITQYTTKYDFFTTRIDFTVGVNKKARGVKWIKMKGSLGSSNNLLITGDDVGPKTSWKPRGDKLDIDISVNFNSIKQLFELIDLPNPVAGQVNYKWHREPKVAGIISGIAGSKAQWKFSASGDEYVDGGHQVFILLRVPKVATNLYFDVLEAEAYYDYAWGTDTIFYKDEPVRIKLETP